MSALAALAYWGFKTGSGAVRWVLAIAAPGAMVVVWALFVSPKATIELPKPAQLAIEFSVFGAAALALAAAGNRGLGLIFAIVALISGTLNYLWGFRSSR